MQVLEKHALYNHDTLWLAEDLAIQSSILQMRKIIAIDIKELFQVCIDNWGKCAPAFRNICCTSVHGSVLRIGRTSE